MVTKLRSFRFRSHRLSCSEITDHCLLQLSSSVLLPLSLAPSRSVSGSFLLSNHARETAAVFLDGVSRLEGRFEVLDSDQLLGCGGFLAGLRSHGLL